MILEQIGKAPGPFGLIGLNVVAARNQLAQHAADEMGVAVVPARTQRMREIDDPHAAPANLIGTGTARRS
jgi:hypothetical protein